MLFINKGTLAIWCLTVGAASAFSPAINSRAVTVGHTAPTTPGAFARHHKAGCPCASCVAPSTHSFSCMCRDCGARRLTKLFADVAESEAAADDAVDDVPADTADDVPAEVTAMDGVESEDEAHNIERPARQQLKKKKPAGKPLSEFEVGSTVTGTIKSIAAYGAFVDFGASTDGLLHISQLSTGFVGDVNEVVKEGQEVEVRIVNIDSGKGQVGLSMMTAEEEAASKEAAQAARQKRSAPRRNNNNSAVQNALKEKGWDSSQMIEGTVVSTVDFGCFVRVDASKLNSEVEGEFDGLVHISALKAGRVGAVTDVVNADDKVQVRVKSIDGNKVSLTMLSTEDEASKAEAAAERGMDSGPPEGAANWKEILVEFDTDMPSFQNLAVVEDRRS